MKFIGIDGLGASGKTELAKKIAAKLGNATIIHTDDFYKPIDQRTVGLVPEIISPDFDWDRMEREVFKTIAPQPPLTLRGGEVTPPFKVKGGREEIVIVVGVYTLQKRFRKYYDFTIWVDAPRDVRIKRMIEREGEAVAREWQQKWLPREERYLEVERPDKQASVVLDNMSAGAKMEQSW